MSSEEDEGHKWKHQYIFPITSGAQVEKPLQKENKEENCRVNGRYKEGGKHFNWGARDANPCIIQKHKLEEILNDIFPLVIIVTIAKFDVPRVLIDGGNFCDIMNSYIFEKILLKKEKS